MSISTGYKKGKKEENKSKVKICFAPRFLIEKEIKTTAAHFQGIYGKWREAGVGIFWTLWKDDLKYYDYLVDQNLAALSNRENLYKKWSGHDAVRLRGVIFSREGRREIPYTSNYVFEL